MCKSVLSHQRAVADPGFPVGGVDLIGGVVEWTPEGDFVCQNEESGPLGGHARRTPPRFANEEYRFNHRDSSKNIVVPLSKILVLCNAPISVETYLRWHSFHHWRNHEISAVLIGPTKF